MRQPGFITHFAQLQVLILPLLLLHAEEEAFEDEDSMSLKRPLSNYHKEKVSDLAFQEEQTM